MNMTNVLHRRSKPALSPRPEHRAPSPVPPAPQQPGTGDGHPAQWPLGAKIAIAILLVATVMGAIGTTAALTSSDDGAAERQLRERVATLSQERDDARDLVDELDDALADTRAQLAAAQAGGDELADRVAGLEDRVGVLTRQRADAQAAADALTVTVAELEDRNDLLEAALTTANRRVADAVADRDALARLFPIEIDAPLVDLDLVGDHDVDLTQIHCAGLASCASASDFDELTITRTPQGHLLLDVPGYVDGGFSRVGDALHMVAHSTTAIPACAGVPRQAEITMTLFPAAHRITADGAERITGVEGVMTVEAPATGACPAMLAFYGVRLS